MIVTSETYNSRVKEVRLFYEDGMYYLAIKLTYENEHGVYEIEIPRLTLFEVIDPLRVDNNGLGKFFGAIGNIKNAYMEQDYRGVAFYEKLIEEKVHEMTLSEIESKLGYKVKVISEK